MNKLNAVVVGVGHLGKIHARIYNELPNVNLVAVVDSNPTQVKQVADEFNTKPLTDYRDAIKMADIASIATPTFLHYEISKEFIKNNIHLLIEKPIALNVEQGNKIINLAEENKTIIQVGHVERFNPIMGKVKEFLVSPKFIEAHRLSAFAFRSTDIDVILDVMIHDLDIALFLIGETPDVLDAVGVNVISDKTDIASVRLEFPSGCKANITASRISDKVMRKMRVFSKDKYTSIDFKNNSAMLYNRNPNLANLSINEIVKQFPHARQNPLKFISTEFLEVSQITGNNKQPLQEEIKSFISAVNDNKIPEVSGRDGLNVLALAENIIQKITESK